MPLNLIYSYVFVLLYDLLLTRLRICHVTSLPEKPSPHISTHSNHSHPSRSIWSSISHQSPWLEIFLPFFSDHLQIWFPDISGGFVEQISEDFLAYHCCFLGLALLVVQLQPHSCRGTCHMSPGWQHPRLQLQGWVGQILELWANEPMLCDF